MKATLILVLLFLVCAAVMVPAISPGIMDEDAGSTSLPGHNSECILSGGCGLKMKPMPPPQYQGYGCIGGCTGECDVATNTDPDTGVTTTTCFCYNGTGSGPDCELEITKRPREGQPPLFGQRCINNSCSGTCVVNDEDPVWIWCEC